MTASEIRDLGRLLTSLHTATVALKFDRQEAAQEALAEAFGTLSSLYSSLDPVRRPVMSAHLQSVYDLCMERLDAAHSGDLQAIAGMISLLTPVKMSMEGARPTASRPVAQPAARPAPAVPAAHSSFLPTTIPAAQSAFRPTAVPAAHPALRPTLSAPTTLLLSEFETWRPAARITHAPRRAAERFTSAPPSA